MCYFWKYEIQMEWLYHPDLGWYMTYMIMAERKIINGWEQIKTIHDVTTKRTLAIKIASMCNEYQLSPVHMRDVIDDMALCK